jgi:hypothetical protein
MLTKMHPTFFNAAFPGMVAPSVEPGDRIAIAGVSPNGLVSVEMPPLPLKMRLTIGSTVAERPLRIDQVGIQVEKKRAFITYRYPFRYEMHRREARSCELTPIE